MADMLMKRHRAKIESRVKYKTQEDSWKNGIYVFKRDELVAFISQMFVYKPGKFKIDQNRYIAVITNALVSAPTFLPSKRSAVIPVVNALSAALPKKYMGE